MSENSEQPVDPWAPPNQDGVELSKPATPPVHDQNTVISMPGAETAPPPPVAPGGAYGYPTGGAPSYGYPPASPYPAYGQPGYGQPGWQQAPSNGMGTTSMVLGIIAVAGFCMYGLGIVLGVLALVFGIIGLKKVNRGEATNRGMAIAGVVLGAIGTLVSAVFLGFIIWAITQDPSSFEDSSDPFATSLVVDAGAR
ncbi:DUF4190 domain-containing protein [Streptomyces showdoensis]|uniref:Integral membrane protein n=1 Tax=Streptomyces showdoensis TaxID=68268 RepID=A0A2P2GY28_STREW|nr:DUF4190 domain-containing protein [Streptomyces showdoensis]KKZ75819.1 integral membrane protein [Streptomyces showdoensis]